MPFDADRHEDGSDVLKKMDNVIALLATEDRWCKFFAEARDGRRCLWGAIWAEDAAAVLEPLILDAIKQVTGRHHQSVDTFNDNFATTHATVLKVLHQARENLRTATRLSAPGYRRVPAALGHGTPLGVGFR